MTSTCVIASAGKHFTSSSSGHADGEAAVLAVLAGNDMLITSDYRNDIPAVLAAVEDGRIAESDIDGHVLRILRCKQAQGWIE